MTPDGTRENPYDIKRGVKLPDYNGTAYVKLRSVYKGQSAVKKARALTRKGHRSYLNYQIAHKGKRQVVVLKLYVKAVGGYEESNFYGSSLSGFHSLYNKKVTNEIKNVEELYLDKGRVIDLKLYNGGHDTVYVGLLLPKSVKTFCKFERILSNDGSGERNCWMRYDI